MRKLNSKQEDLLKVLKNTTSSYGFKGRVRVLSKEIQTAKALERRGLVKLFITPSKTLRGPVGPIVIVQAKVTAAGWATIL